MGGVSHKPMGGQGFTFPFSPERSISTDERFRPEFRGFRDILGVQLWRSRKTVLVPVGTTEEIVMKTKLALPKETLYVLSMPSHRDGAVLAGQQCARAGANDATPPISFTSIWTTPW